jgi:hypothetical protein
MGDEQEGQGSRDTSAFSKQAADTVGLKERTVGNAAVWINGMETDEWRAEQLGK